VHVASAQGALAINSWGTWFYKYDDVAAFRYKTRTHYAYFAEASDSHTAC